MGCASSLYWLRSAWSRSCMMDQPASCYRLRRGRFARRPPMACRDEKPVVDILAHTEAATSLRRNGSDPLRSFLRRKTFGFEPSSRTVAELAEFGGGPSDTFDEFRLQFGHAFGVLPADPTQVSVIEVFRRYVARPNPRRDPALVSRIQSDNPGLDDRRLPAASTRTLDRAYAAGRSHLVAATSTYDPSYRILRSPWPSSGLSDRRPRAVGTSSDRSRASSPNREPSSRRRCQPIDCYCRLRVRGCRSRRMEEA